MTFHIFDLVLIVLVAVSAFFAWRRGFIAETLAVISWVLAFFGALYLGPWMAAHLNVKPRWLDLSLGYVLVFITVLLLVNFISHSVSGGIKRSLLGRADRGLGLLFGIIRGLVVVGLLYIFFFNVMEWSKPDWFSGAKSSVVVEEFASVVMDLIPRQVDGFTILPHHRDASAASSERVATIKKNTARASPMMEPSVDLPNTKQNLEKDISPAMPEKRPVTHKNKVKIRSAGKESHAAYSRSDRNALDKLIEKNGEKENR